jgi:hypothetical protein
MQRRPLRMLLAMLGVGGELMAQRLSELKSETLIRIVSRDGRTIVAPLTEVRADSVHLSSIGVQPNVSIALADVVRYEYAQGDGSNYAVQGALLGLGAGMGLGFLMVRGGSSNDGSMFLDGRSVAAVLGTVGLLVGRAMGASEERFRWVTPVGAFSVRSAPRRSLSGVGLGLAMKF